MHTKLRQHIKKYLPVEGWESMPLKTRPRKCCPMSYQIQHPHSDPQDPLLCTHNYYKMITYSKSCQQPISSQFLELTWISCSLSKWRFLYTLNGYIGSPPITLMTLLSLEWLSYFEHVIQSLLKTWSVLTSTLNHTPLKYSCLIRKNDHEGPLTLSSLLTEHSKSSTLK